MNRLELSIQILELDSLANLSARELSELIKFLTISEQCVGGPYAPASPIDMTVFNAKIYKLFADQGKVLSRIAPHAKLADGPQPHLNEETPIPHISKRNENLYQRVEIFVNSLPASAKSIALSVLYKIRQTDADGEISRQSEYFYNSLKEPFTKQIRLENKQIQEMDEANILTWLAYSLLDTHYDTGGRADAVPISNIVLRRAVALYQKAGVAQSIIKDLFRKVDIANYTELALRDAQSRRDQPSQLFIHSASPEKLKPLLSDKSIAHIIGPVYMLTLCGISKDAALIALRSYCAARQLLDDLHDWKDDLSDSQPTYVTQTLVKSAGLELGLYEKSEILDTLGDLFWSEELSKLCNETLIMAIQARSHLENVALRPSSLYVATCIDKLIRQTELILKDHSFAKHFLDEYTISPILKV